METLMQQELATTTTALDNATQEAVEAAKATTSPTPTKLLRMHMSVLHKTEASSESDDDTADETESTASFDDDSYGFGNDDNDIISEEAAAILEHGSIPEHDNEDDGLRRVRFAAFAIAYENPWIVVTEIPLLSLKEEDDGESSEEVEEQCSVDSAGHADANEYFTASLASACCDYADNEICKTDCWYGKLDILNFKQDVKYMGREARMELPEWAEFVWDAHCGFCEAVTTYDVMAVMETASHIDLEAELVGLEKWSLPELQSIRQAARRVQYQAVQGWLTDTSTLNADPHAISESIRWTCRQASRTSRCLAAYMARMVETEELCF